MIVDSEFHDLVRRACARDDAAAAELVRRFEPELRRVVRFQLTDPGLRRFIDSLDVCQSVLAAFFAQLHAGDLRFTQPQQLLGLLGVMARHKVVDQGRRHRTARRGGGAVRDVADGLGDLAVDPAPEPGDALADRDLVAAVRGGLTAADQDVLDRWLAGDEWPDIAREVGGSPEALRKRLSRAIDAVAGRLGLLEGS